MIQKIFLFKIIFYKIKKLTRVFENTYQIIKLYQMF